MEWRPRRNHPCQILCQSVKGFFGGRAAKMAISYTFLNDPYNSAALPCRLWLLGRTTIDGRFYVDRVQLSSARTRCDYTVKDSMPVKWWLWLEMSSAESWYFAYYKKVSTDVFHPLTDFIAVQNKKLIRRWDSERELSLRRHCARTKNTIDSCINSVTDRFLQRRFTKFSEITQCNGHYAVQGHSRSPILVPIESSYTTFY